MSDAPLMMQGTYGKHDYFVIARKGNMAVGVKPNSISPGKPKGHPGCVWFGARLRVAPVGTLFADEKGVDNVVQFQQKYDKPAEAFPDVVWEASNSERASTTVGALLRGTLDATLEEAEPLLTGMVDGSLALKLTNYLAELIGPEYLIMDADALAQVLTQHVYEPVSVKVRKGLQTNQLVIDEMEKTIGNFGVTASILKKAYAKLPDAVEDADDSTGTDD